MVLAPLVGPVVTGEPEWPSRPAWIFMRMHRTRRWAIVSHGLSDEFKLPVGWEEAANQTPDQEVGADRVANIRNNARYGYGCEVLVESCEPEPDPSVVTRHWLFGICWYVSNYVADKGRAVRDRLEEYGALTLEMAHHQNMVPKTHRHPVTGNAWIALTMHCAPHLPEAYIEPRKGKSRG